MVAIVVVVVVVHEPHLVDKVEIIAQLVPRVTLSRSACTHKHRRALDITRALRSSQSLLRVSYQPRVAPTCRHCTNTVPRSHARGLMNRELRSPQTSHVNVHCSRRRSVAPSYGRLRAAARRRRREGSGVAGTAISLSWKTSSSLTSGRGHARCLFLKVCLQLQRGGLHNPSCSFRTRICAMRARATFIL